jgi:hypothetical protein
MTRPGDPDHHATARTRCPPIHDQDGSVIRRWSAGVVLLAALALLTAPSRAGEPTLLAGARIESLAVGRAVYRDVTIRSVNARTVVITHAGGMSSIRLRELSPEWQARFGYDPQTEAAAEQARATTPATASAPPAAAHGARKATGGASAGFESLIRSFGTPATLRPEVDLRPKFFEMELGVKNQGRRPSCAVFAIVSALEFQNAQRTHEPQKLSEEYLIWATRRTTHRAPPAPTGEEASPRATEDADEGFSLLEVVAALRGYGIPPQSAMPNTFGRSMATIAEPPSTAIDAARPHQRVAVHLIPGHDNATRIGNIVHALNAGMPVPVGIAWPNYRSLRGGFLSRQTPMLGSGHAVTIVGYRASTDRIEDLNFIFKNSWGVEWGQGGYGVVTYGYLQQHLETGVVLEVQRE